MVVELEVSINSNGLLRNPSRTAQDPQTLCDPETYVRKPECLHFRISHHKGTVKDWRKIVSTPLEDCWSHLEKLPRVAS